MPEPPPETMTVADFQSIKTELEDLIDTARQKIYELHERVRLAPLPANLRRAEPADIRPGAVIWYPPEDPAEYAAGQPVAAWMLEPVQNWCIVEEVGDPNSNFKAYIYERARYGLDRAYTECPADDPRRVSDAVKDAATYTRLPAGSTTL